MNCGSLCGNIIEILPSFLDGWFSELVERDDLMVVEGEASTESNINKDRKK